MTDAELIAEAEYDDVLLFSNCDYDGALIGVTSDNRAVYDFDKMVSYLMEKDGFTYEDAVEWIEYNTIRSLPYFGPHAPIVMYSLEEFRNDEPRK